MIHSFQFNSNIIKLPKFLKGGTELEEK